MIYVVILHNIINIIIKLYSCYCNTCVLAVCQFGTRFNLIIISTVSDNNNNYDMKLIGKYAVQITCM